MGGIEFMNINPLPSTETLETLKPSDIGETDDINKAVDTTASIPKLHINHNTFPEWEKLSEQKLLTMKYPIGSISQEYSFDNQNWNNYKEPLLITQRCYVYTRALMPGGLIVSGGIEISNIIS